MNRILIIAIVGFIIIAAVVAAVSLRGGRNNKTKQTTQTRDVNELTIWRAADSAESFKDAIAAYTQDKQGIKINVVTKTPADFENESLSALSAGKGPDIWSIPASWLPKHADKLKPAPDNLLNPNPDVKVSNSDLVKQLYAPIVAEEVVGQDGKVYGLPLALDTLVVFANTDLVRQRFGELSKNGELKNPDLYTLGPRTWDELIELSQALTVKDGGTIRRPGIALGTATNNPRAAQILAAMMLQNQTQMVSADRASATFHLPARKSTGEQFYPGTNALEFFTSFADEKSNRYSWNATLPDARELFIKGELPLLIEFSHFGAVIKQRSPEFATRMWALPQVRGSVKPVDYGEYFVETVTKDAANEQLAWDFIRFMAFQGARLYQLSSGRPPALKVEVVPQNILERATFGSPNQFQQQSAKPWYRGKSPEKVEAAFGEMIDDVAAGRLAPQPAIERAAAQVSGLLRKDTGISPAPIIQPQLVPGGASGDR
ncbi:MAG: extracellular solute-binding protein [Patescibacteria group bacterium]